MADPSVSVVVCTVNRAASLQKCLASLVQSTVPPLEVVVVDQGHEPLTAAAIRAIAETSPFPLEHILLESKGHTIARNAGVAASQGEVVAFTDDDCVVAPGWIEAISGAFQNPQVSCVCGRTKPTDHLDRPWPALLSTVYLHRRKLLRGKRNPVLIGRGNNMAFRRSDLAKLGGFNEQIGVGTSMYAADDTDLFLRLLDAGGTVAQEPDAVVFHSQPDEWRVVVEKKRGYALSTAAVLADRAARGDLFAVGLLAGKFAYEFGYLFLGGLLRANPRLAAVGWHSCLGTLSGLKRLGNRSFREESARLGRLAKGERLGQVAS